MVVIRDGGVSRDGSEIPEKCIFWSSLAFAGRTDGSEVGWGDPPTPLYDDNYDHP